MIATIKIKDLIKYLVIVITIVFSIVFITRYFLMKRENVEKNKEVENTSKKYTFLSSLEMTIPLMKNATSFEEDTNNSEENTFYQEKISKTTSRGGGLIRMLKEELRILEGMDKKEPQKEDTIKKEESKENNQERIKIADSYTTTYKTVKIKNLTKIKLTTEMLKPDFIVKNKKDVIIYHTHTCESYTPTEKNRYKETGKFRTTNLKYSVVRVGDELEKELEKYKFRVTHNTTKHDYPAYTGSYERSLQTIESILKKQKDTDLVFDVHRDAVGNKKSYAPTVKIKGEEVAQLMFVIGTNDGGGKHPNWKRNLKFAVKVQEKANEMYPGLFRAINLRSATFNQKVADGSSIIEVGATGNTLEEATASMKYLAKVLNEVLKE